jgi:hypothetical protein
MISLLRTEKTKKEINPLYCTTDADKGYTCTVSTLKGEKKTA